MNYITMRRKQTRQKQRFLQNHYPIELQEHVTSSFPDVSLRPGQTRPDQARPGQARPGQPGQVMSPVVVNTQEKKVVQITDVSFLGTNPLSNCLHG